MFRYDVIDQIVIQANKQTVFDEIISGYDKKHSWWAPHLTSQLLKGTTIAEKNALCKVTILGVVPIQFIAKTAEVRPGEILKLEYTKGAFVGEGVWEFTQNGNQTTVSFRWQTNPGNLFLKLLATFFPIAKSHSAVMQKGFKNLKTKLEQQA